MELLLELDRTLFDFFNENWSQGLDNFMPYFRHKNFWVPVYVFIIILILIRYSRWGIAYLLIIGATVGISDFTSAELLKKSFQRDRPCRHEIASRDMNQLIRCGGGYSFPSTHASNHMALSVILICAFISFPVRFKALLFLWAVSIGFAQIYVGVHYPSDILAGFLWGGLLGWGGAQLLRRLKEPETL